MTDLSPEQAAAVRELQRMCHDFGAEAVIIGAVAYQVWMENRFRHTEDVDFAVAVDLDDFPRFTDLLRQLGWEQAPRREHRWYTPQGARLDLIPAGPALRRQQQLEWPASGMKMSLVGFDHVFADAVDHPIAPGLNAKIIPLSVLTLLKMVAYLDNPYEREKDIADLAAIVAKHRPIDERQFSDEVLNANLDYDAVGAYWVGKDLQALCSDDEEALVERFLTQLLDERTRAFGVFARNVSSSMDGDAAAKAQLLVNALALGFRAEAPGSGS